MRPDAGPQPTQLAEDQWLLFQKKKSSPYGPYLPGTFHCLEVVRRRTLSQASSKGHRTPSHNGSIRSDTTRSHVIAALLPQDLEPASVLIFHALWGFVQGHNWIFEVLFQQLQSRCISSENVIFASRIIKLFFSVLGCSKTHKAFAFWASCGFFFNPKVSLISL